MSEKEGSLNETTKMSTMNDTGGQTAYSRRQHNGGRPPEAVQGVHIKYQTVKRYCFAIKIAVISLFEL